MIAVLDLFQKLVRRESVTDSYAEVIEILTSLRDSEHGIAVKFAGNDDFYPSVVTAVNPRFRMMTIRESIPVAPSSLVRDTPVTIKTQKQGRELLFASRFVEPLANNLSLGYQLSIPDQIITARPRQAFRVMLDDFRSRVRVRLGAPGLQPLDGTARDISPLGIGIKTDSELPRFLSQYFLGGGQTVACQIELDRKMRIDCRMEIRNVHAVGTETHATLIGGRILDISRRDGNLLRLFVAQLKQEHFRAYA